ncbi:flagellar hook-length control protein FliK [Thalassospira sp. MCCC 1A03138]|uniref:flagellar hook-length control protein FliK n=1 Tax=Thalassospira sp. MCCC 1A03138 TaxID=1470576 RepID=UPI000A1DF209|nr:flagellar hook-length control protein FliK [Thalassospira sp. MCCC 1A03138]OSQ32410.1 hypothetical protein TH468_02105 [Thalassospira sp. MCCC 1A03138]
MISSEINFRTTAVASAAAPRLAGESNMAFGQVMDAMKASDRNDRPLSDTRHPQHEVKFAGQSVKDKTDVPRDEKKDVPPREDVKQKDSAQRDEEPDQQETVKAEDTEGTEVEQKSSSEANSGDETGNPTQKEVATEDNTDPKATSGVETTIITVLAEMVHPTQNVGEGSNLVQSPETTTSELMGSTALSNAPSMSTGKSASDAAIMSQSAMAANVTGAETKKSPLDGKNDFLASLLDDMSGDGVAKSAKQGDTTSTSNNNSNASSGNNAASSTTSTATANSAVNSTASQQMAAATAIPQQTTPQNGQVAAPAKTVNTSSVEGSASPTANNAGSVSSNSVNSNLQSGHAAANARQTPAQQVQQQVAVHIRNAANDGVEKISVQLRPEHLGRVDVKLEISHDGRVQGVIQADTRETLDLLRQDARSLQQALKDAGLNADSQSFTFEHRNEGGNGRDNQGQQRVGSNSASSPNDGDILSGAELAEHVAIGYGINPNGLVDIRI